MQYRCKLGEIKRLPLTPGQSCSSMCDNCKTLDCSNPIQKRVVSIFGVPQEHRLYMMGDEPYIVVECNEGYSE